MKLRQENYFIPGLLLLSLLVRAIYLTALSGTPFFTFNLLDAEYYLEWGTRLAYGGAENFQGNVLYPRLISMAIKDGLNPLWTIRILQLLLGTGTTILVFLIGRECLGKWGGLAAGAIYAVYPAARFYEGWLLSTSLETFLAAGLAAAILCGKRKGWLVAAGAVAALGLFVRPTLLPFGAAAWLLIYGGSERRKRTIIFISALFATTLAARMIGPSPIPAHGGENFYIGNNPQANGTGRIPDFSRPHPKFQHEDFMLEAAHRTGANLSPGEASSFWFKSGIDWITKHPLQWIKLGMTKITLFFSGAEFPDNYHPQFFAGRLPLWGISWGWQLLAALGLTGMLLSRRKRRFALLFFLAGAGLAGVFLFFVTSRFRQPLVPFLCVFAVDAVIGFREELRLKNRQSLLVRLMVVGGLFFLLSLPRPGISPEAYGLTASEALYRAGEYDDALTTLERTREAEDTAPARIRERFLPAKGKTLLALDREEEAQDIFSAYLVAAGAEKNREDRLLEIGNAYAEHHNFAQAAEFYRLAREENPLSAAAANNHGLALKNLGKITQAEQAFRDATRIDDSYPSAIVNLGNIFLDRGDYLAAENKYREALELDPGLVSTRYALAYVLSQQRKRKQAREQIERLPVNLRSRIENSGR